MEYLPVEELVKHLGPVETSNLRTANKKYHTDIQPVNQKQQILHLLRKTILCQYKLLKLDTECCWIFDDGILYSIPEILYSTIKGLYLYHHIRKNINIRELVEILETIDIKLAVLYMHRVLWDREPAIDNADNLAILFVYLFDKRTITNDEWNKSTTNYPDLSIRSTVTDLRLLHVKKESLEKYAVVIDKYVYAYKQIWCDLSTLLYEH